MNFTIKESINVMISNEYPIIHNPPYIHKERNQFFRGKKENKEGYYIKV